MLDVFAEIPALLVGSAFLLSLLVGSFLNVVIHRLPVMLDRQWHAQAREMLAEEPAATPDVIASVPAATDSVPFVAEVADEIPAAIPTNDDTVPSAPESTEATSCIDEATQSVPPATEPRAAPYNLVTPRSACPHCNAPIRAHQNIPVVSYLLLGGKCASCGAGISPRYPIVELATAILSAAVVWRFGWHWQSIAGLYFTWALVALTVIDYDHQILPDVITLPLLWLGLLASVAWHPDMAPPLPADPASAIIGAAAGYLLLWSVYWGFKLVTGKEGMGYGDFKLFGAFGAWMGWQMLPLILLLAAFAGAVVGVLLIVVRRRDRNVPLPFGPYLAAAGWIALMWGPQIVGGYLSFSGFAP